MEELIGQLQASLKGIWKYRWPALMLAWLVAGAGWFKVATLPDDYQSSARVFVDTQTILKPLLAGMTSTPNIEQQVAIMSRTLLSRPNVQRVMRMVDLDLATQGARDHERKLDELMSKIRISGTNSYDIYTISYSDRNPKMVRDVVQSLLSIFVEGSFHGKKDDSDKAVQFIEDQIGNYEDKLKVAENLLKDFKIKNNLLLPRQGIDYNGQLLIAADALNSARLELMEAEQARNAISSQISGDEPVPDFSPIASALDNPEIDGRIASINKNLDTLLLQYTELHPDVVAARRLIAQLEARKLAESKLKPPETDPGKHYSPMLQQLKVALAESDAKVAAMRVRVQEFASRYASLQHSAAAVPEVETQLAQLNRDYAVNKDNYEKLIGRREAAKLSGELNSNTEMMTFKIIDPPTVPVTPVGPNRPLLLSVVLAGAVLAGAAVAFLISQIRPTFLTPAQLRSVTGLAVLGTVAMNWTAAQKRRRRSGLIGYGSGCGALLLAYGAVLAALARH